jgi:hypothetical protein
MFAGRIGPIFIGDSHYDRDVRPTCGELDTSYHVNIPLSGHLVSTLGRSTVIVMQRAPSSIGLRVRPCSTAGQVIVDSYA